MNTFDILTLPGMAGSLLLSAFPATDEIIDCYAAADTGLVISLTPSPEMDLMGMPPDLLDRHCRERGMAWRHMAVADMGVAGSAALEAWREIGPLAHGLLDAGRTVAIHCRMGLGRTGTLAGILLVERGLAPGEAIAAIRRARRGSIETIRQEAMIRAWAARR
jgi:ADP-ribosyl-[dinitrogen reductase] hydrolase